MNGSLRHAALGAAVLVSLSCATFADGIPEREVKSIGFRQGFHCPSKTPVSVAATGTTIELTE